MATAIDAARTAITYNSQQPHTEFNHAIKNLALFQCMFLSNNRGLNKMVNIA